MALFPLLPAIAMMKLPFCGPLTTVTESVPKRLVAVMLDISTNVGLNVQVNSALANPPAGILFKLTATVESPPTTTLGGVKPIVTYAEFGILVGIEVGGTEVGGTEVGGTGVFVGTTTAG